MPKKSVVKIEGIDQLTHKFHLVAEKAASPGPLLNEMVLLFGEMEYERFSNNGASPTFGITTRWKPLAAKTLYNRRSQGITSEQPLKAFHFLMQAATSPSVKRFGKKAIEMEVDVTKRRNMPQGYLNSYGDNYAIFHQEGWGNNPRRPIVTITPQFRKMVREMTEEWLFTSFTNQYKTHPQANAEAAAARRNIKRERGVRVQKREERAAAREAAVTREENVHSEMDYGTWKSRVSGGSAERHNQNLEIARNISKETGGNIGGHIGKKLSNGAVLNEKAAVAAQKLLTEYSHYLSSEQSMRMR